MSLKNKLLLSLTGLTILILIVYLVVFRVTDQEVTIYRMIKFGVEDQGSKTVYTDRAAVQAFTYAVRFSAKTPGIADIVDSPYKFVLGEKAFYLWLDAKSDSGDIASVNDTGTLYKLRASSVEQLKEVLDRKGG